MQSTDPTVRTRVAILDGYQGVALTSVDWSPLRDRVETDVFRDALADENDLVRRLEKYEILCAMRERPHICMTDCLNSGEVVQLSRLLRPKAVKD